MNRTSLRIESLENRQLLDAGGCMFPSSGATMPSELAQRSSVFPGEIADFAISDDGCESVATSLPNEFLAQVGDAQPSIAYSPAQVIRTGNTVATVTTVDRRGNQVLWIVNENASEGAEIAFQVDLGNLFVENLLADGDRLLVIGTDRGLDPWLADPNDPAIGVPNDLDRRYPWFPPKKIVAVDLSRGEVVDEISLAPGFLKHAEFVDGEASLLLNRMDLIVPAIWPPIETKDEIYRFRWDETGLGEIKKDEIPSGLITAFSGNKLVVASHKYSDVTDGNVFPASIEIRSFELIEDGVKATGSVDIGPGYLNSLTINSTGTQAVIIRSQYTLTLDAQPKPSEVIIVDLSGDRPSVIDTVVIETRSHAISQDDDYVLFYDQGKDSLILVSLLNGVEGNARNSTVEVPENITLRPQVQRLAGDRLVMLGAEAMPPDDRLMAASSLVPIYYGLPTTLVTLSLTDGTLKAEPIDGESRYRSLHVIDPQTSRIGFQSTSPDSNGIFSNSFVFGTVNGDGQFVAEGEITTDAFGHFYVDESTLTIATQNELSVYEYSTPETPLYRILLIDGDAPPITAVNDAVTVYLRDRSEDWFGPELVDLLANDQVPFGSYDRTRIVELIDAPDGISTLGDRYIGVGSDAFTNGQVIEFRYRISDGITESVAAVTLTILKRPDDINPGEPIVELSLSATNLAGEPVNEIELGDSFWLELRGKDLRNFGRGLFSAFFSLETTDAITFDGNVEAGEGFTLVQPDRLSEKISGNSIRGLGVIDSDGSPSSSNADDSETLLRVRATANRTDALVLIPLSSRDATQEITVFGNNEALSESQINRLTLTLPIVEDVPNDPTDVDGNGSIEALDALRVINMISRYGTGTVDAITIKMNERSSAAEGNRDTVNARRFDVNNSGTITPLDALVIINEMSRRRQLIAASTESTSGSITSFSAGAVKVGSATLVLLGSNNYSGTTTMNGGTLSVNGGVNQLGTISANGSPLVLNGVQSQFIATHSAAPLVVANALQFNTLNLAYAREMTWKRNEGWTS